MKAKAAQWKKDEVKEIKSLITRYKVFGIINMENIPALQLQRMRKQLRGKILIRMTKKSLIILALDSLSKEEKLKEVDKLKATLVGMPSIIFTDDDPLKLSKTLRKSKSRAPAKAGQTAPNDLVIKAGVTSFAPGPIIGELGQMGIVTEVKEGKVAIKEDKLLVKEGEEITQKQADLMAKLGMEPMEIGLKLSITYQDGEILDKDILNIDEQEYLDNIVLAYQQAFNLAVSIGVVNKETISFLIKKASNEFNILSSIDKLKDMAGEKEVKEKPKEVKEEVKPEVKEAPKEAKEEKKEEVKEAPKEEKKEEVKEIPKEKVKEKPKEKPKEKREKPKKKEEVKKEHKKTPKKKHKEKEVKKEKLPSAQELVEEAGKTSEEEDEKKKEEKYMKEVEDLAKSIMWGESDK